MTDMQPTVTFYLGTPEPSWLHTNACDAPLFVSARRLRRLKYHKPAATHWALDSGGFTELNMHGSWHTSPATYAREVALFTDQIGSLDFASQQDWMCEPFVLQKTGKTVRQHQQLTVQNYLELRTIDDTLPIIPVLQGWTPDDYLHHIDMFTDAGIDLPSLPRVGIGSVCRRASLTSMASLITTISQSGIRLHGFGIKTDGLTRYAFALRSADSMAWSFTARRAQRRLCDTHHRSPKCSYCAHWAAMWYRNVIATIGTDHYQVTLSI